MGVILFHLVTLTDMSLKTRSIKYGTMTSIIIDKAIPLQIAGCFGYAFPPYSQHICNQFLGHHQFIALKPS